MRSTTLHVRGPLRTFVSPGVALLALALGLSGCSDSTSKTLILEPQTGAYALRGHVRLIGRLAESSNPVSPESTGVRTVDNATGVRVFIKRPGGAVDSTVTVDGVYEFRFDEPGSYRVFAWVVAPDTVATAQVATAARDTTIAAVFELGPHGDVDTYPNPFPRRGPTPGSGSSSRRHRTRRSRCGSSTSRALRSIRTHATG